MSEQSELAKNEPSAPAGARARKRRPAKLRIGAGQDALYEALRWREAQRVVYFHTDHFEPWRGETTRGSGDELQYVSTFAEQAAQLPYARKQTLFYNPSLFYGTKSDLLRTSAQRMSVLDGDNIGFRLAAPDAVENGRQMMQLLIAAGHEIQVHLHHEGFTKSQIRSTEKARLVQDWLAEHSSLEMDERRFEHYLQLSLNEIREETGLPLDNWAFIHGNWALNGSFHKICRLTNEIETLMKFGCRGDFTFPSPERAVNPKLLEPYTIVPYTGERCYDTDRAQPLLVKDHPEALDDPKRFLIWQAPIDPRYYSIDSNTAPSRRIVSDTDRMILNWVMRSPKIGDTIYIKTHAHSMNRSYFESLQRPLIPHMHPEIQRGFGDLMAACARAGVKLDFLTVNEVRETLRHPRDDRATAALPPAEDRKAVTPPLLNALLSDSIRTLDEAHRHIGFLLDRNVRTRALNVELFSKSELAAFETLEQEIEKTSPIIEIGVFGQLAFLFAARGNPTCLFDESSPRAQLAKNFIGSIERSVSQQLPITIRSGRLNQTDLTSCVADGTAKSAIAIVTGLSQRSPSETYFARICAALTAIPTVYINLRKFGTARRTEPEFEELIARLGSYGLTFEERVYDDRSTLAFARFRSDPSRAVVQMERPGLVGGALVAAFGGFRRLLKMYRLGRRDVMSLMTEDMRSGAPVVIVTYTAASPSALEAFVNTCMTLGPTAAIYLNLRAFGKRRSTEAEFAALQDVLGTWGLIFEECVVDNPELRLCRFRPAESSELRPAPPLSGVELS